jgi:protein-disulfide isomerase
MERVLIAVGIAVAVAVLAWVLERRRPEAPTQRRWAVPDQLDRADFDRPGAPWLVAVFSSETCDSCQAAVERARTLASADVAVQEIEVAARGDLHRRYNVEAVPTLVLADRQGVVRASFVGPPPADELEDALAEVLGS